MSFTPHQITQYEVPETGATVVMRADTQALLLKPAGTLLTLTITVPTTPIDGQEISISSTQALTTLTVNGGTMEQSLTSLAANGFFGFIYNVTTSTWFRIG